MFAGSFQHFLSALGTILTWTGIAGCLLFGSYVLCVLLGREAQRPPLADYDAEVARGGNLGPGEGDRVTAAPAQVLAHDIAHREGASI